MFQVANLQKIGSEGLVYYIFRTKKEDINEASICIYFDTEFIDLFKFNSTGQLFVDSLS